LQPHPRLLSITLQKDLILLNLNFFDIFYAKAIDPRHHAGHVTSSSLYVIHFFKKNFNEVTKVFLFFFLNIELHSLPLKVKTR